jgi:hypothetical protein
MVRVRTEDLVGIIQVKVVAAGAAAAAVLRVQFIQELLAELVAIIFQDQAGAARGMQEPMEEAVEAALMAAGMQVALAVMA